MTVEVSVRIDQQYLLGNTCTIENGWIWENGTALSADTCAEVWGNRIVTVNEAWDDGGQEDNDGWSANWSNIEKGYQWITNQNGTSEWQEVCGDGYRIGKR